MYLYWQAPPLPLGGSKTYWNRSFLDIGAAWFIQRRAEWHCNRPGLQNLIPDDELTLLLYVEHYPKNGRYSTSLYPSLKGLEQRQSGDFLLVALPKLSKFTTAFSDENERDKAFLLFRKTQKGWMFYPRSLRIDSYTATVHKILPDACIAALTDAWNAGFDALPDFSWSVWDRHAGMPYLLASAPEPSYDEQGTSCWWSTRQHPFWKHMQHALLASAALHSVSFPPPKRSYDSFHWSVSTNEITGFSYKPVLCVELPFDGWSHLSDDESRIPSPHQMKGIQETKRILEVLANTHQPNLPFFMERVFPRSKAAKGPDASEIWTRSHLFPWIYEKEHLARTTSAHDAAHWLSQLPSSWREHLIQLLSPVQTNQRIVV